MDGAEKYFCVDSKPIEVCRLSRGKRYEMGKDEPDKSPAFGYCATQGVDYFTIHAGLRKQHIPLTLRRLTGIVR